MKVSKPEWVGWETKMDNDSWKALFKELLEEYLSNRMTKDEIVVKLVQEIDLREILNTNDELIINSYFALKYLGDDYETTEDELKYLYECLNGKRVFSQEERNQFIIDGYKNQ